MNRDQRKFALATLEKIKGKKKSMLCQAQKKELDALPSVAQRYASVLSTDKNEQKMLVLARVTALLKNEPYLTINADGNMAFFDTSKLTEIREDYKTKRKLIIDKYTAKEEALSARVEELSRQIMLGDLPPQALQLLTEFEEAAI